jgi:quercetin dioxygenase-like cupin family protein
MYISSVKDIGRVKVAAPGASNVTKQVLLGPANGWEGWVMRHFTLGSEGFSPRHAHPWPHIVYVTAGEGTLFLDGANHQLEPGSVAYVPGDSDHQFLNRGNKDFSFICIVPEEGDK